MCFGGIDPTHLSCPTGKCAEFKFDRCCKDCDLYSYIGCDMQCWVVDPLNHDGCTKREAKQ